jgi:DNA repair exonuclease SbcCD ATPase subunit
MSGSGKYNFPKINKVELRNFSLYTKINCIEEDINAGVFCLAGANGLGKTTFLNAINYGLTGIVLQPEKEVYIPDEIVKWNKLYTERYFQGRIDAQDREKAEIEILIEVNNKFIRIIRSFLDREDLRLFEFYEVIGKRKISLLKTNNLSPKELLNEYENILARETNLGKFSFFLFFQLYVLTFDESRRMLFWDERASNSALSIAFNDDIQNTERVLELKKEMEELESYGRNARWQATQINNEISKLVETNSLNKNKQIENLKKEYFDLYNETSDLEKVYNEISIEYDTILKQQNILNSEILQLRISYKKIFSQYSEPRSSLINNPLIQIAKKENKCFICHAEGHQIIESIEKKLFSSYSCPVCDTPISNSDEKIKNSLLNQIKQIDRELDAKNKELENLLFESEIKKIELDRKFVELDRIRKKLISFERKNKGISFEKTGDAPIDTLIEEYKRQFDKFDKQSKDSYAKRDRLMPEHKNLQNKVTRGYKETENVFVPLFKKFAESFIGLNLNIYSKTKGKNLVLYFEMKKTARTASHQLSESQRFFLDIALRMALATYLSKSKNGATLFIDTPEGSLDIAYENRVGNMFAQFVSEYKQNIFMTANINASQLLVSLAEKCGNKYMKFKRMLEWTDLSEIQKEGEHLFNKVYNNINKILTDKNE